MIRTLAARIRRLPLRIRLVLAATALLPVALSAVFGLVFLRFEAAVNTGIDADLRSRANALIPLIAARGPAAIRAPAAQEFIGPQGAFAQVLDPHGSVLASSPQVASLRLLNAGQARRATRHGYQGEHPEIRFVAKRSRLVARPIPDRDEAVVVGRSLKSREAANESFARALLIGGPLSLLLAAAACYLAAARALKPVDDMRRRAEQISAEDSGARLPVPDADDEIARLGRTLNDMLDRLQEAHDQQRVLVQNASHELRTPLTTLTAELEIALAHVAAIPAARESLTSALEESHRVNRLADDLLVLAQLDEHGIPTTPEQVDISDVAERVATRFRPTVPAGREITVAGGPVVASADPQRLEQALGNLVDNALRHGSGNVHIDLLPRGDTYNITVGDDGSGIPPSLAPTAFDRFVRGRTTASGSGLGLAIVAAITQAHGGTAAVDDRGAVRLTLPVSPHH
jgi:signal transduction histidine kinase